MKSHKGFTLIELITVIAIIGILSAVVVFGLTESRQKARDAKRISDMSQIQLALAMYVNKYGFYPKASTTVLASDWAVLENSVGPNGEKFFSEMPQDPKYGDADGKYTYGYGTDTEGTTYCLGVTLERSTSGIVNTTAQCPTGVDTRNAHNNYKVKK